MLDRPANNPEDLPDAGDVTKPMGSDNCFSDIPSKLDDLLLEWEERAEQGEVVAPEELCAGTPELLGELKRRIKLLGACEELIGSGQPGADHSERMPVPERLGYYEVHGLLGRGGGGVVFKAWDPFL